MRVALPFGHGKISAEIADERILAIAQNDLALKEPTASADALVAQALQKPIGSPLVTAPDILIVMNLPSLDKFERKVVPGGCVFVDSSLVPKTCERTDIRAYYIPATRLADEAGLKGLANVIMLGKVIRETGIFDYEFFRSELLASAPKSKPQLGELNAQALKIGYDG